MLLCLWCLTRLPNILWLARKGRLRTKLCCLRRSFCCLRRTFCCLQRQNGLVLGWRLGNNPPFVFCGIRLIGLPAPSGRFFIGVCLPFPLAGQPFHRFAPSILNSFKCIIGSCWMDVSFLLCGQGSRLTPLQALQFYAWAEFPQAPRSEARKPHTNSPAQPNTERDEGNKNCGNLIQPKALYKR